MSNNKLKYLNEAGFSKDEMKRIKKWLRPWAKEFVKRANDRIGSLEKCDFKNNDIFFFTDCRDILSDDPECSVVETNFKIRNRKRMVYMSLFLKQLLGDKIKLPDRPCSLCGFKPMDIDSAGNGYYRYCPKCERVVIDTFVPSMQGAVFNINEQMVDKYGYKEKKRDV